MAVRDKELQFLTIVGTNVATGSDQEDSVDLDTLGINFASRKGMRIFKVEIALKSGQAWFATVSVTRGAEAALRTITSGTTPPVLTDAGIIAMKTVRVSENGAATDILAQSFEEYGMVFPEGLLVASDRLYTYFNNDSGATVGLSVRIWYKLETLTDSDYRELWEIWRRA